MYIDWFDLSHIPLSRDANIVINCFMENREQQILSEIKVMMASIRSQLERLDVKMAELQQIVDPEEFEAESIDIGIDVDEAVEAVRNVEVQEIPLMMEEDDDDDLPFAQSEVVEQPVEEAVEEAAEEPVEENVEESPEEPVENSVEEYVGLPAEESVEESDEVSVEELVDESEEESDDESLEELLEEPACESVEESEENSDEESCEEFVDESEEELEEDTEGTQEYLPDEQPEETYEEPEQDVEPVEQVPDETAEEDDDDLPGIFDVPEPLTVAAKAAETAKPVLNDVVMADYAWKRDMPGSSVRDIRSAIGLNDRVRFINHLFQEDAQAFVNALTEINKMESLDDVVAYVSAQHPEWDMGSEIVYRFMMAVRRKIR